MTLRNLSLLAGMAALATAGLSACMETVEPDTSFAPSAAPSGYTAPVDPATSTSPLPDAPPEIPPEGVNSPSEQIDPSNPNAPPPGSPPPVLPPHE